MDLVEPLTLPTVAHAGATGAASCASDSLTDTQVADLRGARALLDAAPRDVPPFVVARYLAGLRARGSNGLQFIEEWPETDGENPLLSAIAREPLVAGGPAAGGDSSALCACFVNWCLQRTGRRGTGRADSRSFRALVLSSVRPQIGDIAVFADLDAEQRQLPSGYVAFCLRDRGDTIEVVGTVLRYGGRGRIAEVAVPRVRVDPQGRIDRILLGFIPIAALQ